MTIIEVKKEDKEKVLEVLLGNGKFRSLGENRFDIIDHVEEVLKKLEEMGIVVKKVDDKRIVE